MNKLLILAVLLVGLRRIQYSLWDMSQIASAEKRSVFVCEIFVFSSSAATVAADNFYRISAKECPVEKVLCLCVTTADISIILSFLCDWFWPLVRNKIYKFVALLPVRLCVCM